ncbi:MAG: NAD(+) synthase [bacterium]|nr:NAD(+) synthase [bacterium]
MDISPMVDAYFGSPATEDRIRVGNFAARIRMAILFDMSRESGCMVLGTSNRTEFCLGYTTWFGDSAASINPIAELYKTEVLAMARQVGLPGEIIDKPPSADLWPGQTDEEEIGVRYEQIDGILRRVIDDGETSMEQLVKDGFEMVDISRVVSLVNRHSYKRNMPVIAPLGRVAVPQRLQVQV